MRHVPADFSRANSLLLKWKAGGAGGLGMGSKHESRQPKVGSASSLHRRAAASETPVRPVLASAPPCHFFPQQHHRAARRSCGPVTLRHAQKSCAITRCARQHHLGDNFAFQCVHQLFFSHKRLLRQPDKPERLSFQKPLNWLRLWGQQNLSDFCDDSSCSE